MIALEAQLSQQAHRQAVTASVATIAQSLDDLLSRRLTAYMANVKDAKAVARWASQDEPRIRSGSEQRLRVAFEITRLLTEAGETDQTIRAWFVGMNPQLDDTSPAQAIHDGQLKEALAAARAFAADSY